jgi:hypothetical protein
MSRERRAGKKGHGSKFGRKKELAIAALLTHRSVEDAARAVDLTANTLLKWLKFPDFVKEYRVARREVVIQSVARLQQAGINVFLRTRAYYVLPA